MSGIEEALQCLLDSPGGFTAVLVGHEFEVKLEEAMGKLLEDSQVIVVIIELAQTLDKSAAIIVERIFISHEDLCWWVLGESAVRSKCGTDERTALGGKLRLSEVSIGAEFEEGMREDHVIEGSKEAGSVIGQAKIKGGISQHYA
jgi:hypothetical protein